MIKLAEIRNKHNLSKTQMANILEISVQRYSSYETGRTKVPVEIAATLCRKFSLTLDEFFLNTN